MYGHLAGVDGDHSLVLPEMASKTVRLPTSQVTSLVDPALLPAIPDTVLASAARAHDSTTAASQQVEVDFVDYALLDTPVLHVFKHGCDDAQSLLDDVRHILGDDLRPLTTADAKSGVADPGVWPEFCKQYSECGAAVHVVLSFNAVALSRRAAWRLVARGYVVGGCGADTPRLRVKCNSLKWVKDSESTSEVSRIIDYLPGFMHARHAVTAPDPAPWTMALYDEEFNVQRQMLCWGMFSAWVARSYPGNLDTLAEPLRSYVVLIRALEEARERGDVAPPPEGSVVASAAETATLAFNSPGRPTRDQSEFAMRLFYWGAVHDDDASRPVSREHARRALELYLMFGHVVLRKRSYKFQAATKRGRAKSVAAT